jgi:hypothetical protein
LGDAFATLLWRSFITKVTEAFVANQQHMILSNVCCNL